ncbi:T9SS type A sorting domain-containing protein [Mucilaginibacter flavidus]|uniref:T9SS type A sorting domain-containing protein n=1 Tax=Mucilaginibacter flavidus TaxID=2949309 RepID=UPI0020939E14|nr:T9SS type A sorting domain-containing protein [Mucilaginibacter flavidus]MCO5947389.1 T9SS type A sorting domain-containing protein [Mucilaginibacter flavidus]
MKNLLKKPGFEFVFSMALVAILALPPVLIAQNKTQKDMEIRIENGDTTINGKNIKSLSAEDRQIALTDINNLRGNMNDRQLSNNGRGNYFFKRIDTTGGKTMRMEFRRRGQGNGDEPMMSRRLREDTLTVMTRRGKMGDGNKKMTFSYRFDDENPDDVRPGERTFSRMPMREMRRHERRNTQNFDYENTNNDGVVTHLTFHVSEATDDDLKRMEYVEGPKFDIKDLNISPQFSSGKILLTFDLATKAPAVVKLSDSEGKTLWTEKTANGAFSKSFALGLNGVYYLQVKQGKNISLKRIMKEE